MKRTLYLFTTTYHISYNERHAMLCICDIIMNVINNIVVRIITFLIKKNNKIRNKYLKTLLVLLTFTTIYQLSVKYIYANHKRRISND